MAADRVPPERTARIGVIGGSGLYELPGARHVEEVPVETPFGRPSDAISIVEVEGHRVAFLPRHGKAHSILPSEVNSKANIAALKSVGVERVLAFSAVGSLKEELAPLDFVVPRQLIDRTRHRPDTFFGEGVVGHVAFADPFCAVSSSVVVEEIRAAGLPGGVTGETLVCMEGPLFSTRAESEWYRSMGAGLINMSALPEAKLAREAELCYALVCMVTDYDCWRQEDDDVDIQMVLENLRRNADGARSLLAALVPRLQALPRCACQDACREAILTPADRPPTGNRGATASRAAALLFLRVCGPSHGVRAAVRALRGSACAPARLCGL